METHGSIALERLLDALPGIVLETHAQFGDVTARVDPSRITAALSFLRDEPGVEFDMLCDLCAVDYLEMGRDPRFEVVYHLYSVTHNHRLRIKAGVSAGPDDPCEIDSICEVWPAANWMEREVWDLYGIRFRNHPDLRRILLYEEFEGHPLRKDYPKERRQPLVGPGN